jgi:hypothetical protein
MRQIFVALVAAAALIASQNSAQAVFEKVVIDNFTDPATIPAAQKSTIGAPAYGPLNGSASDIAPMRTLEGRAEGGLTPAALVAGAGSLQIALNPDEPAYLIYTQIADAALLANNPVLFLTSLVSSQGTAAGASLLIEAFYDGIEFGSPVIYVAGSGAQDINFTDLSAGMITSNLTFRFTGDPLGTGDTFSGTLNNVVANPEPATMALMGLGVLGGAIGYRRRRKDDGGAPADEPAPVEA